MREMFELNDTPWTVFRTIQDAEDVEEHPDWTEE